MMFDKECRAYANLIHYGLCSQGVVPLCYGIVELNDWDPSKREPSSQISVASKDVWEPF